MILEMFSVYDNKAQAFIPPFFQPKVGQAQRMFTDCANDPAHMFCRNPEDFVLFHLGSWDDNTTVFTPLTSPLNLGLAAQYQRAYKTSDHEVNDLITSIVPGDRKLA